jgi:hypothetical protein
MDSAWRRGQTENGGTLQKHQIACEENIRCSEHAHGYVACRPRADPRQCDKAPSQFRRVQCGAEVKGAGRQRDGGTVHGGHAGRRTSEHVKPPFDELVCGGKNTGPIEFAGKPSKRRSRGSDRYLLSDHGSQQLFVGVECAR